VQVYLDGIVEDDGVDSNVLDLLKWDRALHKNILVTNEDKKSIYKSYRTDDGNEIYKGFGWNIWDDSPFGKIVSHPGSWAGYLTFTERHIDSDKIIKILMNNQNFRNKMSQVIKGIRKILYKKK